MTVKHLLVIIAIVAPVPAALSFTADSLEMKEKVALFQDAANSKQYRTAAVHLHWILIHEPKQHVSIYVMGAEVLDELAKLEKNPSKKMVLIDSLLGIYDLRLRFCGDSANVINRKALVAYRYLINGQDPEFVLALLDEAFRLNGVAVFDATLVPHMQAIVLTSIKKKNMSREEILDRYSRLLEIVNRKEEEAMNDKKRLATLNKYKTEIDELLLRVVTIDCPFIHNHFGPKYRQNKTDLNLAKKIFSFMLDSNCDKDSLWFLTGEFIFRKEPNFGLAKHLGLGHLFQHNFTNAQRFLRESLRLAPTASDSADVLVFLGSVSVQQNDRPGARVAYRQAIRTDPKHTEALEKIGDLYFNSFKDCAREISMADDRLTYLVAYDYYERAGSKAKMEMAHRLFPSREEIFLMNYHAGQTMQVACWINETTVIRTRD